MRTPTGPTDAGVTVPPSGQRRDVRWSSSSRRSPSRRSWSRRSWSWTSSSSVPRVRWAGSRGRRVPVSMLRSGCSPRHGRSGPRPHAMSLAAAGHADHDGTDGHHPTARTTEHPTRSVLGGCGPRSWTGAAEKRGGLPGVGFSAAEVRDLGRVPVYSVAGCRCVGFSVVVGLGSGTGAAEKGGGSGCGVLGGCGPRFRTTATEIVVGMAHRRDLSECRCELPHVCAAALPGCCRRRGSSVLGTRRSPGTRPGLRVRSH
ncbi:hypothetical protein BDK89_1634 [Ilumatobacter fluminis]|uniref:Uncharacterized protein n=1 Tax=Ilumatobacter fluminis TaxID=467091 RepID=A0A4R7HXW1_9ACTN|nr:hypothetical protein BDK89_1634 [Ilumatobacter fluminis]